MAKKGLGQGPETDIKAAQVRRALLKWYECSRRDLPWRRSRDPYAIWVSEIMLQQTRVAAVVERYNAFMARFATIASLAVAPEQDVLALWSGLGYYRRARMLHQAAQVVMAERKGIMPETAAELRNLPGIGGYTSAAIASIAYGERAAVVDGNVERVLCRLAGWEGDSGKGSTQLRARIEAFAARLVDPERPGDFNQAVMELGATLCTPRSPQCLVCPLRDCCKTRGEHKTAPRPRAMRQEAAYALCLRTNRNGKAGHTKVGQGGRDREVLLEQRPSSVTVMPGLWELPPLGNGHAGLETPLMTVRHAIMNVNYSVSIGAVSEDQIAALAAAAGKRRWVRLCEAREMALTGLTRKVLERANLIAARTPHSSAANASVTRAR